MIIGFTGYARSGKDTAAGFLQEMGFTLFHFADPLKEAARAIFSFNERQLYGDLKETVDPYWGFSPREALQRFGTDAMRNNFDQGIWVKALLRRIKAHSGPVTIADVRFPNEAAAIELLGGLLVRVSRPGVLAVNAHASETALDGWDAIDLFNDGTLEDLRSNVHLLAQKLSPVGFAP